MRVEAPSFRSERCHQLQQVQRDRVEQLAATAEAQLLSQPVEAQVNVIAGIGLARSAFVNFPNHPLSASIQGSLLDVIQVNKEQNLLQHTNWVTSVAFSPDGRRIVSGSDDFTLRLWDATKGNPIGKPFTGHTSLVYSVAFSPDGRRIVSGGWDKTLRLWDATKGNPIGKPFTGHTSYVNSVAFSPDGRRIVSGSSDFTLRLWDATKGNPIGKSVTGHTSVVLSVAFSPDGRRIVSGSIDFTLRLWDVSWESWLQIACNQLRYHSILDKSAIGVAKEARETCQQYVWH